MASAPSVLSPTGRKAGGPASIAGTRCGWQIGGQMFGSLLSGESRLAKSAADRTVDLRELRQVRHVG